MANAQRGEIEIEIAGKSYVAKFDFNAIVCLETHFGTPQDPKPLQQIFATGKEVPASMVPTVLWATLHGSYPQEFPSIRELASRLELTELSYYSSKVRDVFLVAQRLLSKGAAGRPTSAPAISVEQNTTGSIGTSSDERLPL